MGDDERQIRRGRNSSAEIAATSGPLHMGGNERAAATLATARGVVWATTWVIVLRSDTVRSRS